MSDDNENLVYQLQLLVVVFLPDDQLLFDSNDVRIFVSIADVDIHRKNEIGEQKERNLFRYILH